MARHDRDGNNCRGKLHKWLEPKKENFPTLITLLEHEIPSDFRSFNYGFNPNDDFNLPSLERWLQYSDCSYWQATVFFDSFEDLFNKILTTDYEMVHSKMEQHRSRNRQINRKHWQDIARYLDDGTTAKMPETFEEGMRLWENNMKVNFYSKPLNISKGTKKHDKWALVSESVLNNDIIYQIGSEFHVLCVADNNKTILNNPGLDNRIEILTVQEQNLLGYRVSNHPQVVSFSKRILVGSLYLLSQGARNIFIPEPQSKGKKSGNWLYMWPIFCHPTHANCSLMGWVKIMVEDNWSRAKMKCASFFEIQSFCENHQLCLNIVSHLHIPGAALYTYSEFWGIIASSVSPENVFQKYCLSLWFERWTMNLFSFFRFLRKMFGFAGSEDVTLNGWFSFQIVLVHLWRSRTKDTSQLGYRRHPSENSTKENSPGTASILTLLANRRWCQKPIPTHFLPHSGPVELWDGSSGILHKVRSIVDQRLHVGYCGHRLQYPWCCSHQSPWNLHRKRKENIKFSKKETPRWLHITCVAACCEATWPSTQKVFQDGWPFWASQRFAVVEAFSSVYAQ